MLGLLQIKALPHMKNSPTLTKVIYFIIALALISVLTFPIPARRAVAGSENTDIPEDGIVQLDHDIDLMQLIKTVSEINNEAYILDESVKPQSINIITPNGGMKKEDFLKFFDVILNLNGLTVVNTDGINKVISSKGIKEEDTPVIIDPGK